jgi:predicted transcriptional regulator
MEQNKEDALKTYKYTSIIDESNLEFDKNTRVALEIFKNNCKLILTMLHEARNEIIRLKDILEKETKVVDGVGGFYEDVTFAETINKYIEQSERFIKLRTMEIECWICLYDKIKESLKSKENIKKSHSSENLNTSIEEWSGKIILKNLYLNQDKHFTTKQILDILNEERATISLPPITTEATPTLYLNKLTNMGYLNKDTSSGKQHSFCISDKGKEELKNIGVNIL